MGTLGAGVGALMGRTGSVHALGDGELNNALKKTGKRVILLWLAGGASQLETWDPKPGRPTGGPFGTIPTTIPGVRISELMPEMAKRLNDITVIRSLNTVDAGHGTAARLMVQGRKDEAAIDYPDLGSVMAREMGRIDSKVPDYVSFYSDTEGRGNVMNGPGFLGARYAPMHLTDKMVPADLSRLSSINEDDHYARAHLQEALSAIFSKGRGLDTVKSHAEAYARVHGLMSSQDLFDVSKEPDSIRKMYGPTLFGEQAILARRMAEAGVPFVRVARAWWDSHGQNFETHQEMVPEFDRVMSALLDDLKQRGMFENTLVIAMGEFGRTPTINGSLGRDHFARAWSVAMFGCGLKRGLVYGATDKDGQHVSEKEKGAGELFATVLSALGIDPEKEYHVGQRPVPLVNPGIKPIEEALA